MMRALRSTALFLTRMGMLYAPLALILVFSGLSLSTSTKTLFVVFVQFLTGIVLRESLCEEYNLASWADRAVSFAVGSLLSTTSHLLLLDSSLEQVAWLLPLTICGIVGIATNRKWWQRVEVDGDWNSSVGILIAITLIVLGTTYKWHLPFGLALLLLLLFRCFLEPQGLKGKYKLYAFAAAVGTIGMLLGVGVRNVVERSRWWWTLNSDLSFNEAVAQSLGRWGFSDHIAAVGQSILGTYHWLPFAWTGHVDLVTGSDAWWISTRAAHVIFILGSVAGYWSIFHNSLKLSKIPATCSTLLASLVGLFVGQNFSAMVGMFWVVMVFWYWNEVVKRNHKVGESIILALLFFGLWLSKPQFAIPVLGGLLLADFLMFFRNPNLRRCALSRTSCLTGAVVFALLFQNRVAGTTVVQGGLIKIDLVSLGSFGELGNVRNLLSLPLALIEISTIVLPLAALRFVLRKASDSRELQALSVLVASLSVLAIFLSDAMYHYLSLYLVGLLWMLSGLLGGLALPVIWKLLVDERRFLIILSVLNLPSFFLVRQWPNFFSSSPTGSIVDVILRTLADAKWIPVTAMSIVVVFLTRSLKSQLSSTKIGAVTVGAVSLVVFSFSPLGSVFSTIEILKGIDTVDKREHVDIFALDEEINGLITLVDSEIPEDAIIASNVFCVQDAEYVCSNESWWSDFVETLEEVHVPGRCYDLLLNAGDWSLPGVLERRFLIQGPEMFAGCGLVQPWLTDRVKWSEEFGRRATLSSFSLLSDQGVSWFIADRRTTSLESWAPYGDIVLDGERFVLIKLRKLSSSN